MFEFTGGVKPSKPRMSILSRRKHTIFHITKPHSLFTKSNKPHQKQYKKEAKFFSLPNKQPTRRTDRKKVESAPTRRSTRNITAPVLLKPGNKYVAPVRDEFDVLASLFSSVKLGPRAHRASATRPSAPRPSVPRPPRASVPRAPRRTIDKMKVEPSKVLPSRQAKTIQDSKRQEAQRKEELAKQKRDSNKNYKKDVNDIEKLMSGIKF